MKNKKHLYSFSYHNPEYELCKLESRSIFNEEEKEKALLSDVKAEPSSSAFIKSRLDIISFSEDYSTLIDEVKKEKICVEDFKVEYLVFDGDTTEYRDRLGKLKDIGFSIEGDPDYYNPRITYALCCFEGVWCFGVLIKDTFDWRKHKDKPHSYSNSISASIAKAIVNIAVKAKKEQNLLDACCGVGTILLEACFAGNSIEGCDINEKVCKNARENLSHFNYTAKIYHSDIKDISKRYDAAIIDLPYNLFSSASDNDIVNIIESTAEITDRLVIVSTTDITSLINNAGFRIADYCIVSKMGKRKFTRKIWVCEKEI